MHVFQNMRVFIIISKEKQERVEWESNSPLWLSRSPFEFEYLTIAFDVDHKTTVIAVS